MFLVLGNLVFLVLILAFLGSRYRDIAPAITSVMTIVFFLSPVMYKPSQLGVKENLMWLNPFSHLITLIRDPITGLSPELFVYQSMSVMFNHVCSVWLFFDFLLPKPSSFLVMIMSRILLEDVSLDYPVYNAGGHIL